MAKYLNMIIRWMARAHDAILTLNDSLETHFSDKQLHFLVIGALGMLMIFIVYPLFKALAEHGHTMVVAWIYVFTLILVITFAIEIGQWYSGTGSMETMDIAYGVLGFLVMFFIFAVLRGIFKAIKGAFRKDEGRH